MSETLTAPSGTISTIEFELDGIDQLQTPRNWADGAQRVNVQRIGYKAELLGACLCANGGVATNFGATPAREVQAKLNRLSMIGNVIDWDASNDELLIDNLTIEPDENYGPIVRPTETVLFDVTSSVSADCVISGGTYAAPNDLEKYYVGWRTQGAYDGVSTTHALYNYLLAGVNIINLGTFTMTVDAAGVAAFKAAAIAAGYTFPNEPQLFGITQPPLLDPNQQPLPSGMFENDTVWWEVPTLGANDPGLGQSRYFGIYTPGNLHDNTLWKHVGVPEQIGPPAAGVSILVFLKPLGL